MYVVSFDTRFASKTDDLSFAIILHYSPWRFPTFSRSQQLAWHDDAVGHSFVTEHDQDYRVRSSPLQISLTAAFAAALFLDQHRSTVFRTLTLRPSFKWP